MTDFSKRQRLEATILSEPTDRPPVALWRHWPGDDQDATALATAHLKWQQDYDWDFVKVSPSSSFCLRDWGVEDRWAGSLEGTREYTRHVISGPADWEALAPLDPGQGSLQAQIAALRLIGEGLGHETPFIATIFSPLAQAKNLAGGDLMASHMRSHSESFRRGLETITESTLRYVEAARATGMSGIYFAVQHSRYALMSPAEYRLFGHNYDQRILDAVSDLWLNVLHVHGDEGIMFDVVADYPVQVVNWHDRESGITLLEGLGQIRGAASGGVSRWTLHQESPEAALAEANEALVESNHRRLILGTGCVVMTTTPTRNIRALRQLVEPTANNN